MVDMATARIASLDVKAFTEEVRTARTAVQVLVDRRERIKAEIATMAALGKADRMGTAAELIQRLVASVSVYKDFKAQVNGIQKDMEDLQTMLTTAALKEMTSDEYVASFGWVMKRKLNPPKVDVIKEKDVEKKWRKKPPPHPDWQKWPLDKVKILAALKAEKEVTGCALVRGIKLVVEKKI